MAIFDETQTPTEVGAQPVPGIGGMLEPTPGSGPPATPQEFEERKSGWQQFAHRLQTDPQVQQLVLNMGLRLMQDRQPGVSARGHVAGAIGDSMEYMSQKQMQQKEQERKERESASTIAHQTAQTEGVQQQTRQRTALESNVVETSGLSLQEARLTLRTAQIGLQTLENKRLAGMDSEQYFREKRALEQQMEQANLALKKAQASKETEHAGAYRAAANAANERPRTPAVRQTQAVKEMPDGSIVSMELINGVSYVKMVKPALNSTAATNEATRLVTEEWKAKGTTVPGTWDNVTGSAAKKEFDKAVALKAATLRQPRVEWLDENNRKLPGAPETPVAPVDTVPSNVTPAPVPAPARTGAPKANQRQILSEELAKEEKLLAAATDPKAREQHRDNITLLRKALSGEPEVVPSKGGKGLEFVRDASGRIVVKGEEGKSSGRVGASATY